MNPVILTMKVWLITIMTLPNQSPRKKKQSITTVGLEISIDYSLTKTNIKIKPTSVTAACMASPKKASSPNTKKIAMVSTRIDMAAEGSHIKFKNHQNQMPVPYVIYADFENIVKPKTEKAGDKSEITSEHEACGFGYQVVRYDGQAEKPVIYRGKNVIEVFLNHFECELSNINNIFAHPKPLIMTEQNTKDYEKATKCWICEHEITEKNPKVRDHCHFTGEYRGAAHKSCNLKLKIKQDKNSSGVPQLEGIRQPSHNAKDT